jgi:hypothetical protein
MDLVGQGRTLVGPMGKRVSVIVLAPMRQQDNVKLCETAGSHGGKREDDYLLGCAIESGRNFLFQRYLLLPSTVMVEAASNSETSVNFYQTTWHNFAEYSHLQC